jgi:Secretion system C-terminal sorting domain
LNNTATNTYTFTPNAGQCASTTTMTIIVTPCLCGLALVSAQESDTQTFCLGEMVQDIIYDVIGNPTTINITGLPNGVTGNYNGTQFIISGTPTHLGYFPYLISTEGCINTVTKIGFISITPTTETPVFSFSTVFCQNPTEGVPLATPLPTTSDNGLTGTWDPAYFPYSSQTITFTPDAGQCAAPVTSNYTVMSTSAVLDAVNDDYILYFMATSQSTPSVLVNDTLDGVLFYPGSTLGSTVITITANPYITIDPINGELHVAPLTPIGDYYLEYQIKNSCVNDIGKIMVHVTGTLTAPARFVIQDCFSNIAHTTEQSILQVVELGGVNVGHFSVPVNITTNNVFATYSVPVTTTGLTINQDGTMNIPAGLTFGVDYYFDLTICLAGSTTDCIDVIFGIWQDPRVVTNDDGIRYLPNGTLVGANNILLNDKLYNCNGSSFVTPIAGTSSTANVDLTVNSIDPYFQIDADGFVSKAISGIVPVGVYNFNYTICAKNTGGNDCKTADGVIQVAALRPGTPIKEEINFDTITIAPNPTDGIFTVYFETTLLSDTKIEVYNLMGQKMLEDTLVDVKKYVIDATSFSTGTYLLKITNNDITTHYKIIKK